MMPTVNATLPGKENSADRILPDYRRPPHHGIKKAVKEKIVRGGEGYNIDFGHGKAKPKRHVTAKHIRV